MFCYTRYGNKLERPFALRERTRRSTAAATEIPETSGLVNPLSAFFVAFPLAVDGGTPFPLIHTHGTHRECSRFTITH